MTKLSVKTTDRSAATERLSERQHTEPQSSKSTNPKRLLAVSLNHLALSPPGSHLSLVSRSERVVRPSRVNQKSGRGKH